MSLLISQIPKSQCLICSYIFNSTARIPLFLPCGHTFCDKCIKNEFRKNKSFVCQYCNKKIYTHYSKLVTNQYILNMRYKSTYPSDLSVLAIDYNTELKEVKQISFYFIKNQFEDLINPKQVEKNINKNNNNYHKVQNQNLNKSDSKIPSNNSQNKNKDNNSNNKSNIPKTPISPAKKKKIEYFIKPTNREFPQLFNYFEVIKNIIKFSDKYKNVGTIGKIIKFLYQPLITILLIYFHFHYLFNFEFGFFYMFMCILYLNENNLYDITLKIKMYCTFVFLSLLEDFIYKIGLSYFVNISIFYNIFIVIRTIYTIFVLGNELTLNTIISQILWIMVLGNLLVK